MRSVAKRDEETNRGVGFRGTDNTRGESTVRLLVSVAGSDRVPALSEAAWQEAPTRLANEA
jgi:hypothetical protein